MEIESTDYGIIGVLRPLTRRIDAGKSPSFKEKFAEHLSDGYRWVALNLMLVDYVDNSGLNAIADVYRSTTALKGMMVIFGAKPPVMNQLKLSGISNVIKIFTTVEEAVAYLETINK